MCCNFSCRFNIVYHINTHKTAQKINTISTSIDCCVASDVPLLPLPAAFVCMLIWLLIRLIVVSVFAILYCFLIPPSLLYSLVNHPLLLSLHPDWLLCEFCCFCGPLLNLTNRTEAICICQLVPSPVHLWTTLAVILSETAAEWQYCCWLRRHIRDGRWCWWGLVLIGRLFGGYQPLSGWLRSWFWGKSPKKIIRTEIVLWPVTSEVFAVLILK